MTELQVDVDLPYPPELVWRALTDPGLLGEWWLPVDLAPQEGESFRAFPPSHTPVLPATLEVDVLQADKPSLLSQRWSGDELHTHVTWEILPQEHGSRLRFTQQGFFGIDGKQRRMDLRDLYVTMLTSRLPAALSRASGAILAPTTELPRLVAVTADGVEDGLSDVDLSAEPKLSSGRRWPVRLLIGATVGVAVLSLAAAIYPASDLTPASGLPASGQPVTSSFSPQPSSSATGIPSALPGVKPDPTASVTSTPSPESTASPSGPTLTATYRTMSVLGIGGFDTEVTVYNSGSADYPMWTVVLVMPDAVAVTNRTPNEVEVSQQGEVVTIKPLAGRHVPAKGTVTFVVRRPGLVVAGAAKSCAIDTKPCQAG